MKLKFLTVIQGQVFINYYELKLNLQDSMAKRASITKRTNKVLRFFSTTEIFTESKE
jgi:hypothetical protein